jgi:hypothetical protein
MIHESLPKESRAQPRIRPLWRKAPLAMRRFRGTFVALAVGALLIVVAAASYPLFISATASDVTLRGGIMSA